MTVPDQQAAMYASQWERAVPDPIQRARWRAEFGDHAAYSALLYWPHFTDPDTARTWFPVNVDPDVAGVLHNHGITPNRDAMHTIRAQARTEHRNSGHFIDPDREDNLRIILLTIHPHLDRDDRDAAITSGLTFDEIHHLIETGTFDRDALTLLGALT